MSDAGDDPARKVIDFAERVGRLLGKAKRGGRDLLMYQTDGDDPKVLIELPDDVEPETYNRTINAQPRVDVDALSAVYEGESDAEHYAVFALVVRVQGDAGDAVDALRGAIEVASSELLHHEGGSDDDEG